MRLSHTINFTSTQFKIIPGEEEDINPGCYGLELSIWLKNKLEDLGYENLEVENEDWGRYIAVYRDKALLFIGIGSVDNFDGDDYTVEELNQQKLEWLVFVELEYPFFSKLFTSKDKKRQHEAMYDKLKQDIIGIISAEPEFHKL